MESNSTCIVSGTLREAFFNVLGVNSDSPVRESIVRTADAFRQNAQPLATISDLFSDSPDRCDAAVEQLAALWIAAKFWAASLQRVSLLSILTDMLFCHRSNSELPEDGEMNFDTFLLAERLRKEEFGLLRRTEYIVPGVSL